MPLIVPSVSSGAAETNEDFRRLANLEGAVINASAPFGPAPLIVDAKRNLGFAIGRPEDVDVNHVAVYDLDRLKRTLVGPQNNSLEPDDIFRFAVDERNGRLIGPERTFAFDGARCDPASGTDLQVYDYDDSGASVTNQLLKMPCSGTFKFVPFSASLYDTADGSRKLVAAGSYAHEGARASQADLKNNLGQPLIIRQLDLAALDSPQWQEALDWEIDLRYARCGRWASARVLVERLGDDLLSYCWDTEPLLRSLGAQGYVVRIPLGDDNTPDTVKGTPVLPDPANPTPFVNPPTIPPAPQPGRWLNDADPVDFVFEVLHFLCPLPVPLPPSPISPTCNNSPTGEPPPDPSGAGVDADQAVEDIEHFGGQIVDQLDPGNTVPPLTDPENPTNSKFIANALVRRIPTFPGSEVDPFVDRDSGRLLLLTADDVNGNAVWVFDPREERFIGLFTGGDPEQDPLKTAAGFNRASGRGYIVTSRGLLVGSVRTPELSGRVFPVVGDYEKGRKHFRQTVPSQSLAVAPALGRVFIPVLDTEVMEAGQATEFGESDRVDRIVALLGSLAGALLETPPNVTKADEAIDRFLEEDPLGRAARDCADGVSSSLGHLVLCLNGLVEQLREEGLPRVAERCVAFLQSAPPGSPFELAQAIGKCTDLVNEYLLGQPAQAGPDPETRNYYLVLEDRGVEEALPAADDPDQFTRQVDEEPGKTEVDQTGATRASGARVLVTGGVPRIVNQTDPACEPPNRLLDALPVNERSLFDQQCLADQIVSSGNREYHLAYVDADTGSATGANAEASGFFVPLTERPTDEDIRNLGRCGAGTLRRLANPLTSQSDDFRRGYDDFLGGMRQACDPVQEALHDGLGDDLRQGTHGGEHPSGQDGDGASDPGAPANEGAGFPVASALCNDFGSGRVEDSQPRGAKSLVFNATVICDGGATAVEGQALAAAPVLPSDVAQAVGVGRVWSDVRSAATRDGRVTAAVSIADGVRIGPIAVATMQTTARTVARGRTGTASTTIERVWCGVDAPGLAAPIIGCRNPATDAELRSLIDDVNQTMGKVRISVPEVSGPAGQGTATPGGYQAVVTKDPKVQAADQAVNEDDSLTAPAAQVVVFNDGPEGRSRVILQLAGVQAESTYGIIELPDFSIPDIPELDFRDDPVVEALEVAAGTPPNYEIIEAIPASLGSDNPLAEFFQAPFSSLRDLLGWIMQNWREAMLLFLLLSILSTPLYLFLRRRAFEQAMVS